MEQGIDDQLEAARRDAHVAMSNALGLPITRAPGRGTSPFLEALLDKYCSPERATRCAHLDARPMQPWVLMLPIPVWRCQPCTKKFSDYMRERKLGFDTVEEFTCDRCRRYLPNTKLLPAVMRQDLFVIIGSLCSRCEDVFLRSGGKRSGS